MTFENFRGQDGQPITVTTGDMEARLIILVWNKQYWSLQTIPTSIVSSAPNPRFYYDINIRKTYGSVEEMNADLEMPLGMDGRYISIGNIVTVVNESDSSENGIYSYEGDSWKYQGGFEYLTSLVNTIKFDELDTHNTIDNIGGIYQVVDGFGTGNVNGFLIETVLVGLVVQQTLFTSATLESLNNPNVGMSFSYDDFNIYYRIYNLGVSGNISTPKGQWSQWEFLYRKDNQGFKVRTWHGLVENDVTIAHESYGGSTGEVVLVCNGGVPVTFALFDGSTYYNNWSAGDGGLLGSPHESREYYQQSIYTGNEPATFYDNTFYVADGGGGEFAGKEKEVAIYIVNDDGTLRKLWEKPTGGVASIKVGSNENALSPDGNGQVSIPNATTAQDGAMGKKDKACIEEIRGYGITVVTNHAANADATSVKLNAVSYYEDPNDHEWKSNNNPITFPAATEESAGVMSSVDKKVINVAGDTGFLSDITNGDSSADKIVIKYTFEGFTSEFEHNQHEFELEIPAATADSAGVMSSTDKKKLNNIYNYDGTTDEWELISSHFNTDDISVMTIRAWRIMKLNGYFDLWAIEITELESQHYKICIPQGYDGSGGAGNAIAEGQTVNTGDNGSGGENHVCVLTVALPNPEVVSDNFTYYITY